MADDSWEEEGGDPEDFEDSIDEDDDLCCRPDNVQRRCTDPGCMLVFCAALIAQAYVLRYCWQNGDFTHFRAFLDLNNSFCLGNHSDRYLYFCMHHVGQLDPFKPICVSSCPNDTHLEHSFACEEYGMFANTSDYVTEPYFGMMCQPLKRKYSDQVQEHILQTRHSVVKRLVLQHWEFLVACMIMTVITSYIYLAFVGRCAHVLIWSGIILAMLVPLFSGAYLMGALSWMGLGPRPYDLVSIIDVNPVLGAALLVLGLSVGCCGWSMSVSVDKAMACLEDAISCFMDTPMLQWQPLIHVALSILTNAASALGIMLLLSCQNVSLGYGEENPIAHMLLLNTEQTLYLVFLVGLVYWTQHTNFMLSSFVITYLAQVWCFNGGLEGQGVVKHCIVCKAYWAGIRYHLGSMMKGGLFVGVTRPVRFIMGSVIGFTEMRANALGAVLSSACCFCISCYERWIEHLNQDAVIEVALNARPFFKAAVAHENVLDAEVDTKRILHGATRVFQWAGLVIIGCLGALEICAIRTQYGDFEADTTRQLLFVKVTFGILGLCVAVAVCFPFMSCFDTVADTILYIRTVESLRSQRSQHYSFSPVVLASICCGRARPTSSYSKFRDERVDYPHQDSSEALGLTRDTSFGAYDAK